MTKMFSWLLFFLSVAFFPLVIVNIMCAYCHSSFHDLLERQDTFWLKPMRNKEKRIKKTKKKRNKIGCLVTQLEAKPKGNAKWKTLFLYFHTDGHWQWLEEKKKSVCVSFWHDLYATTITYSRIQIEKKVLK
jgi:hypothetical protein